VGIVTTYDAGSIKATAELDRDPFVAGLRAALEEGREFGRQKFTAKVDVDTANARRKLEELRLLMRRIADESIDINVNVDTGAARIRMAELRAEQARYRAEAAASRAEQSRWNAVLGESKVRLEQQRQETMRTRTALRDYERQVQSTARTTQRAAKDTKDAGREFSLIRVAIEQLGPALIPVAGGALAGAAALAGLGTAGILAFKGIQAEYQAGTALGLRYAAGVRSVKDELGALEHTAAGGVLTGFEAAQAKMLRQFPAFNAEVATSSRMLGDIGQHLVGGLVGGFSTFAPLIHTIEGDVDSLAARFEAWATGAGGAKFAQTLLTDYGHVRDFLGELGPALSHIFSAVAPLGTGMLDNLTALLGVIRSIPVPILRAAATAYLAWRTALLVTAPLTAAAKALEGLRAAQLATAASTTTLARSQAAAGGWGAATLYGRGGAPIAGQVGALGRTAGYLAAATRAVIPYAAAWAAATLGIGAATNATERWRHSVDSSKSTLANTLHLAHDWLTFNWGATGSDINDQRTANRNANDQAAAQGQIGRFGLGTKAPDLSNPFAGAKFGAPSEQFTPAGLRALDGTRDKMRSLRTEVSAGVAAMRGMVAAGAQNTVAFAALEARTAAAAASYHRLKDQVDFYANGLKTAQREQANYNRTATGTQNAYRAGNASRLQGLEAGSLAQAPTLTAGVGSLQSYAKAVEAARKSEESWTKVTDDNTVSIRGVKFETSAYNAALAQTHGDVAKAAGLLLGHRKALEDDNRAGAEAARMQDRLSGAIGAAERKYSLSDQQLNTYAAALGVTTDQLAKGTVGTTAFVAMVGRVKGVIDNADTATAGWVDALTQFEQGADTAAARGQLLAAAMVSFNGTAISYGVTMSQASKANQDFVDAFGAMGKHVFNAKKGLIDFRNAGAQPVLVALQKLQTDSAAAAAATYQNEVATKGRTRASRDAASVYWNDTHQALVAEHKQLGLTRGEAEKLANRYFHWPKDAKTRIEAMGVQGTNKLLNGIGEQLAILTKHPWISTLEADTRTPKAKIADLQARIDNIRQNRVPGIDADTSAGAGRRFRSSTTRLPILTVTPSCISSSVSNKGIHGRLARGLLGGRQHVPRLRRRRAREPLAADCQDTAGHRAGMGRAGDAGRGLHPVGERLAPAAGPRHRRGHRGGARRRGVLRRRRRARRVLRRHRAELGRRQQGRRRARLELRRRLELGEQEHAQRAAHPGPADRRGRARAQDVQGARQALERHPAVLRRGPAQAGAARPRPQGGPVRARQEGEGREHRSAEGAPGPGQARPGAAGDRRQGDRGPRRVQRRGRLRPDRQHARLRCHAVRAGLRVRHLGEPAEATRRRQAIPGDLVTARKMHLSGALVRQFSEAGPASMLNLEAIINAGQGYVTGINKDYASLASTAKATGVGEANALGLGKKLDDALAEQAKIAREQGHETRKTNRILHDLRGDLHTLTKDIKDARRADGGKR
jgi:hypothetical protein